MTGFVYVRLRSRYINEPVVHVSCLLKELALVPSLSIPEVVYISHSILPYDTISLDNTAVPHLRAHPCNKWPLIPGHSFSGYWIWLTTVNVCHLRPTLLRDRSLGIVRPRPRKERKNWSLSIMAIMAGCPGAAEALEAQGIYFTLVHFKPFLGTFFLEICQAPFVENSVQFHQMMTYMHLGVQCADSTLVLKPQRRPPLFHGVL